jgi:DNA-binding MarR family transcriptional regulator/GNAT superfamily N-acetyltransferase
MVWEIDRLSPCTPGDLAAAIDSDPAQVSRILANLERGKIVKRVKRDADKRAFSITLLRRGEELLSEIIKATEIRLNSLLANISPDDQLRLFSAMKTILALVGVEQRTNAFVIRERQLGDVGKVLHLHGVVYAVENAFTRFLESHVAKDLAALDDPDKEERSRLWIAETDGEFVGSVGIIDRGKGVAQLHWLMVKSTARGCGVGKALVAMAVRFARDVGFTRIFLETGQEQQAARHIYHSHGFKLMNRQTRKVFGRRIDEEKWELRLDDVKSKPLKQGRCKSQRAAIPDRS